MRDQMKTTRAALPIQVRENNEDAIPDVINTDQWTSCHVVIQIVSLAAAADGGQHGRCDYESVHVLTNCHKVGRS